MAGGAHPASAESIPAFFPKHFIWKSCLANVLRCCLAVQRTYFQPILFGPSIKKEPVKCPWFGTKNCSHWLKQVLGFSPETQKNFIIDASTGSVFHGQHYRLKPLRQPAQCLSSQTWTNWKPHLAKSPPLFSPPQISQTLTIVDTLLTEPVVWGHCKNSPAEKTTFPRWQTNIFFWTNFLFIPFLVDVIENFKHLKPKTNNPPSNSCLHLRSLRDQLNHNFYSLGLEISKLRFQNMTSDFPSR